MNRDGIYLVPIEPAKGHEQSGRRPVLIVSSAAFNKMTKAPIVLPFSNGGNFARRIDFAVQITGIATVGIIRSDQPHTIGIAGRQGKKIDELPSVLIEEVMAQLQTIFE